MRKKIEMSTERIHIAKQKEEQARKVCRILYFSSIIELVSWPYVSSFLSQSRVLHYFLTLLLAAKGQQY